MGVVEDGMVQVGVAEQDALHDRANQVAPSQLGILQIGAWRALPDNGDPIIEVEEPARTRL